MSAPVGSRRDRALALFVPFAIYVVALVALGDWIIDDAGISYAYARNLAEGHGLVSQPGRPPVEGFSNFLWVLLLTPFFVLRAFHPVFVPKALAALLVLGAFAAIQRALARRTESLWPGFFVTLLLACSPPIVIWTGSGLENALLLCLVAALYARAVERPRRWQAQMGVITALIAMTRPDGPIFAAAGVLLCLGEAWRRRAGVREAARSAGAYLGALALLYGPFLALRLKIFGLPFPHTYYAKRVFLTAGERLDFFVKDPGALKTKFLELCAGIAGPAGVWLIAGTLAAVIALAIRGRLRAWVSAAAVIQVVAIGGYLWMDEDWMGEYRFATPAILASLLAAVAAGYGVVRELLLDRHRRALTLAFGAVAVFVISGFLPRVVRFAENPPTPYADVDRQYAQRFNAYADALGVTRGSILIADVGAMLMNSKLTVYDAAGLCEPDVVRTLKGGTQYWNYDHPDYYAWVFETIKPTFITTHKFWTQVTALEHDPRFARDYVAIDAYEDGYVKSVFGRSLRSGDFVRRDALAGRGDLDRLRASYRAVERRDPLVVRIGEAWAGRGGATEDAEALRKAAIEARHSRQDANRAATLFARVLERAPGDLGAAYELATALDSAGRTDEAHAVWGRVLSLGQAARQPAYVTAAAARLGAPGVDEEELKRMMRAGLDALYARRAPDEAIAVFERVLAKSPTHYGASYQLAAALERAGRAGEARAQWVKVLAMAESYSDGAVIAEARARIGDR